MNQSEEMSEKSSWSITKHYPRICLERLRKTMKVLCQDSHSSFGILTRDQEIEFSCSSITAIQMCCHTDTLCDLLHFF
jgi:hypothetical protein